MRTIGPHARATSLTVALGIALSALLIAGGAGIASAQSAPASATPAVTAPVVKDDAALAILKKMCDRLQKAKTFTVRSRISMELPVAGGNLATFYNDFETSVRRPDGMAAHRTGDLPEFLFAYDGKAMTVSVPGTGKWSTTSAPATLDAMLPAAGEKGDLSMPFDEFVVADPYAAITNGITDAVLADQATRNGKPLDHIVVASPQLRLEYWIDPATSLPARSLVVYMDHPLRPHFVAEFSDWKIGAKVTDATFALPKPKGSTQVEFRDATSASR